MSVTCNWVADIPQWGAGDSVLGIFFFHAFSGFGNPGHTGLGLFLKKKLKTNWSAGCKFIAFICQDLYCYPEIKAKTFYLRGQHLRKNKLLSTGYCTVNLVYIL